MMTQLMTLSNLAYTMPLRKKLIWMDLTAFCCVRTLGGSFLGLILFSVTWERITPDWISIWIKELIYTWVR